MSISRRAILSLLGGAAGSAAAGVSPRDALGLPDGQIRSDVGNLRETEPSIEEGNYRFEKAADRALREMRQRVEDRSMMLEHMPHNIRAMKSWSATFKAHVHTQELREYREIERRLYHESGFAERLGRLILGDE